MRNYNNTNMFKTGLNTVLKTTIAEIKTFIQDRFKGLNRRSAIIGFSGGLDSSLTAALAVKSLGKELVSLYYLLERDSKPIHRKHAMLLAEHLDLNLNVLRISRSLQALGVYRLLPLRFVPTQKLKAKAVSYERKRFLTINNGELLSTRLTASGCSWVARGNAYASSKHRLRMVALYLKAESTRSLVIGAANRT